MAEPWTEAAGALIRANISAVSARRRRHVGLPHGDARVRATTRGFRDAALRLLNRWANKGALRILIYHGLCADHEWLEPWVPSHYVTQSAFDEQLAAIRRIGVIVDLREAVNSLRHARRWHAPMFVITFDDAPANFARLAAPVLAANDVRATIFAVTDRLEDGELLTNDANQARSGAAYRHVSVGAQSDKDIAAHVRESLRHMRWDEATELVRAGHWLGAHTRTHAVLARADRATRRDEIAGSIAAIRARLRTSDVPFAYPRGLANDFDDGDVELLQELRVPLACTGIAGPNHPSVDPLRLRRNCIGLYHRRWSFAAELLGLRDGRQSRPERVVRCR